MESRIRLMVGLECGEEGRGGETGGFSSQTRTWSCEGHHMTMHVRCSEVLVESIPVEYATEQVNCRATISVRPQDMEKAKSQ